MTVDDARAFGERLRELRVERGVTQKALARAAGINQTTASILEQGAADPHLSTVLRIARGLGVAPRVLVEDPPPDERPERLARGELSIFSPYRREQLRSAGADLTDAEDFYYFAAERVAHGEPVASAGAPQPRHVEMLRLRLLEGLTLREVSERMGVGQSAVGHLLGHYFGIEGVPPAAKARRRAAAR